MTEQKTKTRIKLPMICVCSEDGKEQADRLQTDFLFLWPLAPSDRWSVTSSVISSLEWDYGYSIEGIHTDQWFGIVAEGDDEVVRVECDRVEDGLLTIWWYLRDTKKSRGEIVE